MCTNYLGKHKKRKKCCRNTVQENPYPTDVIRPVACTCAAVWIILILYFNMVLRNSLRPSPPVARIKEFILDGVWYITWKFEGASYCNA